MTLVNGGVIVATGSHALTINTGVNVVINTGTFSATGAGGLIVLSAVENTGLIWANGGNVTITGAATGAGDALISGAASLEFAAASGADVAFALDAAGTLILGGEFTGVVSGFDANDSFDFTAIDFGAGVTLDYAENIDGAGGLLTVSDGTDVVTVELAGLYDEANFHFVNDGAGGTLVTHDLLV